MDEMVKILPEEVARLDRGCEIARRFNASIPFPAMDAGTAESLAFQLEETGTFGSVTPKAVAEWLRAHAKGLRNFEVVRTNYLAWARARQEAAKGTRV